MTRAATTAPFDRIVIYRPDIDIWFKRPLKHFVTRQRLPNKYAPLFDWLLASSTRVGLATSLVRRPGLSGLIHHVAETLGLLLWCVCNRIRLSRVERVSSAKALSSRDLLFVMHYGNLTHELEPMARAGRAVAERLATLDAIKLVHLTHYVYQPKIGAENLAVARPDWVVAENDLGKNSAFFKTYFGAACRRSACLPYTVAKRFVRRRPFAERLDKLVATGSITFRLESPEFESFFATKDLSPLRRQLLENAGRFPLEIDCLISDLDRSRDASVAAVPSAGITAKLKRLLKGGHPQQNYYRKDIVSVYNDYRMFVVPEEVCGLPAIGFVEGMACGCAYFGRDDPMYADIGMIAGVHYVAYDGTLDHLVEKVRFFQRPENATQLEAIADRGHAFVRSNLTPDAVYGAFASDGPGVTRVPRDACR